MSCWLWSIKKEHKQCSFPTSFQKLVHVLLFSALLNTFPVYGLFWGWREMLTCCLLLWQAALKCLNHSIAFILLPAWNLYEFPKIIKNKGKTTKIDESSQFQFISVSVSVSLSRLILQYRVPYATFTSCNFSESHCFAIHELEEKYFVFLHDL